VGALGGSIMFTSNRRSGWASGLATFVTVAALGFSGVESAKADCSVASVDIGFGNCDGNGSPDFLSPLNVAVGFFNGSGNANAPGLDINA
jgi:hypothetical protein